MSNKPRTVEIDGKEYAVGDIKAKVKEYTPPAPRRVKVGNVVKLHTWSDLFLVCDLGGGELKLFSLNDGERLSDRPFDRVIASYPIERVYASVKDAFKSDPIAW